ncbi:MAG: putative molybdenum carrier protein [Planctomycetota bacterium]
MASTTSHTVSRIVSGGQTGVDQGALDAAIWLGIDHGGWCPRGRRSEAGPIPERFQLEEMEERDYSVRTEQNVVDSDATLVLFRDALSGGTAFTVRMTKKHEKPCLTVDLTLEYDFQVVRKWLSDHEVETLNVAGPRASSQEGIAEESRQFIVDLLR